MNRSQVRRMWVVIAGLSFLTIIIVGRLFAFQVIQGEEWRRNYSARVVANPERGIIYDRNGTVLAANSWDYQVHVTPNNVTQKDELATALAPILDEDRQSIYAQIDSDNLNVLLEGRVSQEIADSIRALDYEGIYLVPLPRRIYPQGHLMSHVLGYVDFDSTGQSGLEAKYQSELAGASASADVEISPLAPQPNVIARDGADLVLTIDRTVQRLAEQHLQQGIQDYFAESGSIIVMDPRTGAVLAMASYPDFDPYAYYEYAEDGNVGLLTNPAVTSPYEPGSVMKLVTMAAALDAGTVTPQSTYNDTGVIYIGGSQVHNWDLSAPGTTDMETILARSLNIGAATLAMWMGSESYYNYLAKFSFGRPVGVDLGSEVYGLVALPGSPLWTEASLITNSYGQGFTTTSLQMLTSVAALANDGVMMKPYLVQEIRQPGEDPIVIQPTELGRPVSQQTAQQVTAMATNAVRREVEEAAVAGYTIAGKTGSAQIPENGVYHPEDIIGSFIGWLPADDPELIIIVKIDRPHIEEAWGSTTAAPVFASLVEDLVTHLDIPPDNIRLQQDVYDARNGN